jgi:hypothetical protein
VISGLEAAPPDRVRLRRPFTFSRSDWPRTGRVVRPLRRAVQAVCGSVGFYEQANATAFQPWPPWSVAVTLASATAAPLGSVTVPEIDADVWASSDQHTPARVARAGVVMI